MMDDKLTEFVIAPAHVQNGILNSVLILLLLRNKSSSNLRETEVSLQRREKFRRYCFQKQNNNKSYQKFDKKIIEK